MRLSSDRGVSVGTRATFYARLVSLGKTLAFREVERADAVRPQGEGSASSRSAVDRARAKVDAWEDERLEKRLSAASAVVIGEVVSLADQATVSEGRLTEHDPHWRVATILIEAVLKGNLVARERVQVRFAESRDVLWFEAPKLAVGQAGLFILFAPSQLGDPVLAASLEGELAVLAPGDVRRASDGTKIRGLLGR